MRNSIADKFANYSSLDDLQLFFKCYLFCSLAVVELCRQAGITPTGYFYLQTQRRYKDFDNWTAELIDQCCKSCYHAKDTLHHPAKSSTEQILVFLEAEKSSIEEKVKGYLQILEEAYHNKTMKSNRQYSMREPAAIVCIDEARALISQDPESSAFRSFRRALSECWEGIREKKTWYNPVRDYFGLLLDTSSRLSNFSPQSDRDVSLKLAKFGLGKILFPPIYAIDMMDVYAELNSEQSATISHSLDVDVLRLFAYGRPLWGSHMATC
jgi:hypothetical protein